MITQSFICLYVSAFLITKEARHLAGITFQLTPDL
jgi:hypothetical protein